MRFEKMSLLRRHKSMLVVMVNRKTGKNLKLSKTNPRTQTVSIVAHEMKRGTHKTNV